MPYSTSQFSYKFTEVRALWGGYEIIGPLGDPAFSLTYNGPVFVHEPGIDGSGTTSSDMTGLSAVLTISLYSTSPSYDYVVKALIGDLLGDITPRNFVL